ncbi:MAG TPA: amino acid ABC transporter substrate-binding protein [Candidatus Binatia bacterium]|nr:amino acid ABC transporter substrate-binding protein [Candidatus Binatia bacterium]
MLKSITKTGLVAFIATALLAARAEIAAAKVEGDTIILGAAVSLTGKYSTNGKNTRDGYDLAVKRINENESIKINGKSYKFKIIYYDDESTPARAAQLAERLINQDGVKYMLGPYSSGLTTAIAPVTEKYKIPMVEGNGAALSLFNKGYKYLFATLSSTEYYLKSAIALMAEKAPAIGKKPQQITVAMAFENDPFSRDVRAGVVEDAKKYGMKIVIDDKLPPEINDMAATLTKVKALKPDLLVVSGHEKGATLVVRQTNEMKVRTPMMAITHCDSAKVAETMPAAAEGFLCASQWDSSLKYSDKLFGRAEDYAKLFEKTYQYAPPYQAAESSATVQVFADAFQRCQCFEPEKLRDAIAATDMETFYGHIKFDKTGKNIAKPMILYQVQKGDYRVVAPTKWAEAKVNFPLK